MLGSAEHEATPLQQPRLPRKQGPASYGPDPAVLADIYEQDINLAVWQRSISSKLRADAVALMSTDHPLTASMTVSPDCARDTVCTALKIARQSPLCKDVADLVDMFCCLFDQKRVGLRFAVLDRAMCPRFHVDNVSCRLLTTYLGASTEWIPNESLDRSRLGKGSLGRADHESGLYRQGDAIRRLAAGDVALLKGEGWVGNEGRGIVHRSPAVPENERRLVMTIDMLQG